MPPSSAESCCRRCSACSATGPTPGHAGCPASTTDPHDAGSTALARRGADPWAGGNCTLGAVVGGARGLEERKPPMDRQQEYVLRAIEERDIRFIRLWFTDVLGVLKSVAIAPAEIEAAFAEGIGFDGSSIEGLTRVYEADMLAKPDPATFQLLPWRGDSHGVARMFCDILTPAGEPARSRSEERRVGQGARPRTRPTH